MTFAPALAVLLALLIPQVAHAQMLKGRWVDATEKVIDRVRKVDVRVLVLDEDGNPAQGASVRIEMQRHAFPFGLTLDPKAFSEGSMPDYDWQDRMVYRAVSATSIDGAGRWDVTQDEPDKPDFARVDRMLGWSEQADLPARWGGAVSADRARVPAWADGLSNASIADVIADYTATITTRFGSRVSAIDLYTHDLDHNYLTTRLGTAMLRRMYQTADTGKARRSIRYYDAFTGNRLHDLVTRVTELREAFVPIDEVAIEAKLTGSVLHQPIVRGMTWLEQLNVPVVVVGLEVGGPSPMAAAVNLETLLRTCFANPNVRGIYFAAAEHDRVLDPSAALIDSEGQPTAAGRTFDAMVRRHWWTDVTQRSNMLGEIRMRVFAGQYKLTATMPDGTTATTSVFLAPGRTDELKNLIVLQPLTLRELDADKPDKADLPLGAAGSMMRP